MRIKTIDTDRLYLRSFEKEDARFAIGIWNDPTMGEHLLDEAMDTITEEYLREIEALAEDEECCYLIAQSRESGERIGTCSFMVSQDGTTFDIAYCVHRDHWRKGYATEMVGGMIAYARTHGGRKVTARINKDNTASNKVAAKFGFQVAEEHIHRKRGVNAEVEVNYYELNI